MTVKELIEKLQQLDGDWIVLYPDDYWCDMKPISNVEPCLVAAWDRGRFDVNGSHYNMPDEGQVPVSSLIPAVELY